jgi:hypothetical protein
MGPPQGAWVEDHALGGAFGCGRDRRRGRLDRAESRATFEPALGTGEETILA